MRLSRTAPTLALLSFISVGPSCFAPKLDAQTSLPPVNGATPVGSPGVPPSGSPFAYPSECGFAGVSRDGHLLVGRNVGATSLWWTIPDLGPFSAVTSAATSGGGRIPLALPVASSSDLVSVRFRCDRTSRMRPRLAVHKFVPRSADWGAFSVDAGQVLSANSCGWGKPGLCVTGFRALSTGGFRLDAKVSMTEQDTYNVAFARRGKRLMLFADPLVDETVVSEVRSMESGLLARQTAGDALPALAGCRVAIIPPYSGSSLDVAYIARCLAAHPPAAQLGWIHFGEKGLERVVEWGGDWLSDRVTSSHMGLGEVYSISGLASHPFATDGERLVSLYDAFDRSVRAVRGDGMTWLVRAGWEGEMVATCVRPSGIGRSEVVGGELPVGLRTEGNDLLMVRPGSVGRLTCDP